MASPGDRAAARAPVRWWRVRSASPTSTRCAGACCSSVSSSRRVSMPDFDSISGRNRDEVNTATSSRNTAARSRGRQNQSPSAAVRPARRLRDGFGPRAADALMADRPAGASWVPTIRQSLASSMAIEGEPQLQRRHRTRTAAVRRLFDIAASSKGSIDTLDPCRGRWCRRTGPLDELVGAALPRPAL